MSIEPPGDATAEAAAVGDQAAAAGVPGAEGLLAASVLDCVPTAALDLQRVLLARLIGRAAAATTS
jgi:hypothetical protein